MVAEVQQHKLSCSLQVIELSILRSQVVCFSQKLKLEVLHVRVRACLSCCAFFGVPAETCHPRFSSLSWIH